MIMNNVFSGSANEGAVPVKSFSPTSFLNVFEATGVLVASPDDIATILEDVTGNLFPVNLDREREIDVCREKLGSIGPEDDPTFPEILDVTSHADPDVTVGYEYVTISGRHILVEARMGWTWATMDCSAWWGESERFRADMLDAARRVLTLSAYPVR